MDLTPSGIRVDKEILKQANILWDYLRLGQPLKKCDCLIAMGSHDLRVAEYAASLVIEGWSPLMVCSGGLGRLTRGIWNESEAEKFSRTAKDCGVAAEQILIENRSTNTGENIIFSKMLLEKNGYDVHSAILVHKPYMERRSLATAMQYWPELKLVVTSPQISLKEYATPEFALEEVIQIMVGDFQRIVEYPKMGFQAAQDVNNEALHAYSLLLSKGFNKYTLNT